MTAVIQRVSSASVSVDGDIVGKCREGLLILLGVAEGDSEQDADLLAVKIPKLRIFNDENGKMNLSLADIGGSALVISNFTLLANYRHGNRPDYYGAASPAEAERLYNYPEVDCVYLVSGGYDFMVMIEGKTMRNVAQFVSDKLSPQECVLSTATHFILKKYKDHGSVMVRSSQDERQLVTL